MHSLQELVDVVTKNKVKSIRTLEPKKNGKRDMVHDFYDRLCNREFANDEEAAKFYGYENAKSRPYRKQRGKLEERLTNSIFFIDFAGLNEHQKIFYKCQYLTMAMRHMLARNAKKSGTALAKRIANLAVRYELNEIASEALMALVISLFCKEQD